MKRILSGLAIVSMSVLGMDPSYPDGNFSNNRNVNFSQISNQEAEASSSQNGLSSEATSFEEKMRYFQALNNELSHRMWVLSNLQSQPYQTNESVIWGQQLLQQIRQLAFYRIQWMRQNRVFPDIKEIDGQNVDSLSQGGIFPNLTKLEIEDTIDGGLPIDDLYFPRLNTIEFAYSGEDEPDDERLSQGICLLSKVSETLRNLSIVSLCVFNFDEDEVIIGSSSKFRLSNEFMSSIWKSKNLMNLEIQDSHLDGLLAGIGVLTNLEILSLSQNEIKEIPASIGNLVNLKKLNLNSNNIINLPESIGNLVNLKELEVMRNDITNLPESIGNLVNLEKLDLSFNPINELSENIGNLINLKELYLCDNKLTSLPEGIGNLINLKELYLCDNKLTSLPEGIGNLVNLKELDIFGSRLKTLPESIVNLTNLTNLILEDNILESLPENIGNLINLEKLNLKRNNLTSLPKSIGNLVNLKELEVRGNSLKKIPLELGNLSHCSSYVLSLVMNYGAIDVARKFIEKKDTEFINNGLIRATDRKNKKLMNFFLDAGADVNFEKNIDSLSEDESPEDFDVKSFLMKNGCYLDLNQNQWEIKSSSLGRAVVKGKVDILKLLLKRGAIPNGKFLNMAMTCYNEKPQIMDWLVRYDPDVNTSYNGASPVRIGNDIDSISLQYYRLTPLMQAVSMGYLKLVSSFLNYQRPIICFLSIYKRGASLADKDIDEIAKDAVFVPARINVRDENSRTALVHAIISDKIADENVRVSMVNMLLKHGANPNIADEEDKTALVHAIISDKISDENVRVNIVKMLLEHGANPNVQNNEKPMIIYALEHGYTDIAKLLLRKGVFDEEILSLINEINMAEEVKEDLIKTLKGKRGSIVNPRKRESDSIMENGSQKRRN